MRTRCGPPPCGAWIGRPEALFAAIQAVVRAGDEVIVFDPCYDSYVPAIELAGGRALRLPLTARAFGIDWDRFAAALSPRTRLVVVNSPHNPSGSLLSTDDHARLASLLRGRQCFVLSDEDPEKLAITLAADLVPTDGATGVGLDRPSGLDH